VDTVALKVPPSLRSTHLCFYFRNAKACRGAIRSDNRLLALVGPLFALAVPPVPSSTAYHLIESNVALGWNRNLKWMFCQS
jgi:hypothetical protein